MSYPSPSSYRQSTSSHSQSSAKQYQLLFGNDEPDLSPDSSFSTDTLSCDSQLSYAPFFPDEDAVYPVQQPLEVELDDLIVDDDMDDLLLDDEDDSILEEDDDFMLSEEEGEAQEPFRIDHCSSRPSTEQHLPTFVRPALPQDDFPADIEEEEDDGLMLAQLMERAEQQREGEGAVKRSRGRTAQSQSQPSSSLSQDSVSTPATTQTSATSISATSTPEERKAHAVAFLESLVMSFLNQLIDCYKIQNNRKAEAKAKKNKKNIKGLKKKGAEADSQQQESGTSSSSQSQGSQKKGAKKKQVEEPKVGVTIGTKNRKTGVEQIVSWPEDPTTFNPDDKDTAMIKMARIFRIASLLHQAILSGTTMNKRDIYYHDVHLFKQQSVSDKIIDDLVASASLKRADFNVCAASKGLVASATLRIFLKTGEELSMSSGLASLIPPYERIARFEVHEQVDWILLVEKEAVFNTLCSARLLEEEGIGRGVILTGKGYPDLSTIQLAARLAQACPAATIHALVDGDPDGLDILSTYTFGSRASKHSHDHHGLALGDRLKWMGVKITELDAAGLDHDHLLPMSERDANKALAMLRNRPNLPTAWKRELSQMLHLNRKAEIEIIQCGQDDPAEDEESTRSGHKLVQYIAERLQPERV